MPFSKAIVTSPSLGPRSRGSIPSASELFSRKGFCQSKRQIGSAMRPFDVSRDGFALGEGAAFVLLESMSYAAARGAHPRAIVAGYGSTKDAASGSAGIARAIRSSLADAGLGPSQVDAVFAWGDCTIRGDLQEATALYEAFGSRAKELPVACMKPVTGNMLGASATAEIIFAALAIQGGLVPPTLNHHGPDPLCALEGLSHQSRAKDLHAVLCLSRGLHGQTVALTLRSL